MRFATLVLSCAATTLLLACTDGPPTAPVGEIERAPSLATETRVLEALDSQLGVGCLRALTGKCFGGSLPTPLDLASITDIDGAATYCFRNESALRCGFSECIQRVAVLAGVLPCGVQGNPCLP